EADGGQIVVIVADLHQLLDRVMDIARPDWLAKVEFLDRGQQAAQVVEGLALDLVDRVVDVRDDGVHTRHTVAVLAEAIAPADVAAVRIRDARGSIQNVELGARGRSGVVEDRVEHAWCPERLATRIELLDRSPEEVELQPAGDDHYVRGGGVWTRVQRGV